ncbi:GFA family protein [Metallibacterium scheffleri]|uniref:GFA family protein n=1 Tax=Metallibacterium scheffleri TaxID=993689 RepID=UPI0023F16AB9|nr:GFA family protein [Metallibacterium scheffleri]
MRFECQLPVQPLVLECDCSICRMSGYLHLIIPAARFRLLSGAEDLREYRFNTGTARHLFCATCGIKSFYVPRSHPDGIDINLCCLDVDSVPEYTLQAFRDTEREASTAALAHLSVPGPH